MIEGPGINGHDCGGELPEDVHGVVSRAGVNSDDLDGIAGSLAQDAWQKLTELSCTDQVLTIQGRSRVPNAPPPPFAFDVVCAFAAVFAFAFVLLVAFPFGFTVPPSIG